MQSRCFKLFRAYSISFNSSNVGEFFWRRILKVCLKVWEKEKKVVVLCSCLTQNVKSAAFTFPIMQFVFPTKFCLRIVFSFSRDDHWSQEKLKTILMQNFVGKTNCIMGTWKSEIRHFHVLVVQWWQRNVPKTVLHLQSFVLQSELTLDDRQTLAG